MYTTLQNEKKILPTDCKSSHNQSFITVSMIPWAMYFFFYISVTVTFEYEQDYF
jgi:hypothetical protein